MFFPNDQDIGNDSHFHEEALCWPWMWATYVIDTVLAIDMSPLRVLIHLILMATIEWDAKKRRVECC